MKTTIIYSLENIFYISTIGIPSDFTTAISVQPLILKKYYGS